MQIISVTPAGASVIIYVDVDSLCNWFVENKLSIHFAEDITKSILFGRKKYKNLKKMNIRRGHIETLSGHISRICFG